MSGSTANTLVVAIGSAHGDDRAAWSLADLLCLRLSDDAVIRKASAPIDIIDWLDGVAELHIIDACEGGGSPGELVRCDWQSDSVRVSSALDAGTSQTRPLATSAGKVDGQTSHGPRNSGCSLVLRRSGTHDFDVWCVLDLAEKLHRLPQRIVIWGIVGTNFGPSDNLSLDIQSRLQAIANVIGKEITDARAISGAVAAEAG